MNIRFLGFQDIKRVCDIMRLTLWSLGCTSNTETPKNSLSHICNKILHDIESDRILKRLKSCEIHILTTKLVQGT